MGLFDSPETPTPPNPMATASAQTGTNVSTAIANSYLGNVNQNTPQGNLGFDVSSNFNYTDPTTGQSFSIPRWTATQTLNPQAQQTFDTTQRSQTNLAGMAEQQSAALKNLLGTPFSPSASTPGMGDISWFNQVQGPQSQLFDAKKYLSQNPDVQAMVLAQGPGANAEDLARRHWQEFGQAEGRSWMDQIQSTYGSGGNITKDFDPNFNAQAYLQQNPDVLNYVRQTGEDPIRFAQQHYNEFGKWEGRAGGGMQIQSGYDRGGDITRSYGPADNFSADRQRIEQSMFERVNPQLQQDEARLRQRLADQGINYGSQAFTGAYDPFNRSVTDTRLGIVAAGGQEQQRMNDMAAQRAGFENAAQMQAYQQNQQLAAFGNAAQQQGYAQQLGRAGFQNQAQAQAEGQAAARGAFANQAAQSQFEQAMGRGQFFNQAQNQLLGLQSAKFNAQNQLRNQGLQEQYQLRNQPINEITALLSGSQVAAPSFISAQRNTIPTTDVAGLINQNFAQQNDIYKTGMSTWGDIIGGALGAAGSIGKGYMQSDVRVKENIAPMGSILSPKGELPIYAYDYKNDDPDGQRHVGPMAQDVERIDPTAVKSFGGVKHIKRDKLGSIFGSA